MDRKTVVILIWAILTPSVIVGQTLILQTSSLTTVMTTTTTLTTTFSPAQTSVMPSVTPKIPTLTPPRECSNSNFLNESNRARTYNNTAKPLCDTSLSGWYRFSGGAGNQMAESCVPYKHCSADATGWISGGHPAVADGAVQRKVCFSGKTKCCGWSINISVRNCGEFYVYQLQRPPYCNFRYCGNGISSTPAPTSVMPSVTPKIPTPTPPSSVCPHLITLKESSGVITSPNYPSPYSGNQACSWQITASKGKRIKLVIEAMFIQQCRACTCDYLEIQNGSFADGTPSGRECGGLFGNVTYYSNTEILKVLFVSDGKVQMRGFKATYTQFNYTVSTECSNYSFLNESNRAITFFNLSISYLCDTNLKAGWYRFSGGAGNRMADTCVDSSRVRYCSTDAHGWLSGTHPVVAEGVIRRKVCFPNFGMCCVYSNYIDVRNCGSFFVYKLEPPPHCFLRYCGDGLQQAPECYNYKFLNESSRARSYNKSKPSCFDTALSGWYRFNGEAGNQMADSCVSRSHCGTTYPGWLSGGHPKVEEGVVKRRVCFTVYSCCHRSIYTSVRNCGLFYVYKLAPLPACNLRYCGGGFLPPTTSPVPASSSVSPSRTVPASSSASPRTAKPTAPTTNATTTEPTIRNCSMDLRTVAIYMFY